MIGLWLLPASVMGDLTLERMVMWGGRFKKPGQQGGDAAHVMSAIRVEQGEVRIPVAEHGGTLEETYLLPPMGIDLFRVGQIAPQIPWTPTHMMGLFRPS
jgi:hypothetical protein